MTTMSHIMTHLSGLCKTRQCESQCWVVKNRPFPNSLVPLFQNESKCEIFHTKMSSVCSFIFMQIKVIFIRMVRTQTRFETEAQGTRKWPVRCIVTPLLVTWNFRLACVLITVLKLFSAGKSLSEIQLSAAHSFCRKLHKQYR